MLSLDDGHLVYSIERLPKSVTSLLKAGEDLSELPGIGKDLAGKIASIVATHRFEVLNRLKRELPGDLGEIAALPGLGPKRIKLLYDKLGIRSLEDLRRAVRLGRLRELRGFGVKSEQKLAAALAKPQAERRFKLSEAEAEAEALLNHLRQVPAMVRRSWRIVTDAGGTPSVISMC